MKKDKRYFIIGLLLNALFIVWTMLIKIVDVQAIGPNNSAVGFATVNGWFHQLSGVHMSIYTITDWLGIIPFVVCVVFGFIGLIQLIQRKNLFKVDLDILILGVYYIVVIAAFLFFEFYPINYRPVLIDGLLESSFPSSTTLLVLSVMPTLILQTKRRVKNNSIKMLIYVFAILFSAFMAISRLLCGVHWLTDVVAGVILSGALYSLYKAAIMHWCE